MIQETFVDGKGLNFLSFDLRQTYNSTSIFREKFTKIHGKHSRMFSSNFVTTSTLKSSEKRKNKGIKRNLHNSAQLSVWKHFETDSGETMQLR